MFTWQRRGGLLMIVASHAYSTAEYSIEEALKK